MTFHNYATMKANNPFCVFHHLWAMYCVWPIVHALRTASLAVQCVRSAVVMYTDSFLLLLTMLSIECADLQNVLGCDMKNHTSVSSYPTNQTQAFHWGQVVPTISSLCLNRQNTEGNTAARDGECPIKQCSIRMSQMLQPA